MVRLMLLAAALLAAACSNRPVMVDTGADLPEEHDGLDASEYVDGWDEAGDIAETEPVQDVQVEDMVVNDIPSELEPLDCVLPIRDCGPGCRQVTCAGVIYWTDAWDVSGSYVAYFASKYRDVTRGGLNLKDLNTGLEMLVTEYPDLHYDCQEVVMEGPILGYRLILNGITDRCKGSLRWIDTRSFVDDVAFCYYSNPDGENFFFRWLDVYGDLFTWVGHDEGERDYVSDLFTFDLTAMQMTRLTYYDTVNYRPKIWGRNITYDKWWDGNMDIFLWDLDAGEAENLTAHPSDQWEAGIWENRVVWTDHRNGPGNMDSPHNTDIYWCELPDCEPRAATTDPASQMNPTVGGDWIVWIDYRNAEDPQNPLSFANTREELWGYNIMTETEYLLFSFENTVIDNKLRVENGKLYFLTSAYPECLRACDSAVFELDLEQFL